ncbi:unnamed protein product [Penicillium manginii]
MSLLTRGNAALRFHRPQSYNLSVLQHPSVRYQALFSTSARHANRKSTTTTTSPSNPTTTVPTPTRDEINAPLSTFPATIETPPQDPSTPPTPINKIKRLISTGRAYLTFYKTGLKNVFRNYRASIPLRKSLSLPVYLPTSPPRNGNGNSTNASANLGRAQYQLVRRSARDVRRMIPFTLILLICGEFTPLIIPLFGAAITPATCRVPSQIAKERESASKRKYLALAAHANIAAKEQGAMPASVSVGSAEEMALLATRFAGAEFAVKAGGSEVLVAGAVFGIVGSHRPRLGGLLMGPVYRPRLRKFALEERGLGDVGSVLRKGGVVEDVERRALEMWLEARKG